VVWLRSEEYGVETLVMDDESRESLTDYLAGRIASSSEIINRPHSPSSARIGA